MKRLGLILAAAVLFSACATSPPTPTTGGHKFGSSYRSVNGSCLAPLNTITGNNATITVFDTSTDTGNKIVLNSGSERLLASMFFDQAVTVLYQVRARGSVTWRTVNGNGSGDAVTASTFTAIDFRIMGQDNRIQVVTGATGPTTAEFDICPTYDTPASI